MPQLLLALNKVAACCYFYKIGGVLLGEGRTFYSSNFLSFFLVLLTSLFFWDFTAYSTTDNFKFSYNKDYDAAASFSFDFN